MISDWSVPFVLTVTGVGSLPFNQPFSSSDRRRFQFDPSKCQTVLPVRSTEDDIPQADGKIPHRRWRSGFGAHLAIELWQDFDEDSDEGDPACGLILQEMTDELGLFLNAMIRTGLVQGESNARLIWTPADNVDRMLDRCQLASAPTPTILGGELGGLLVELDIDTPFPYYISAAEIEPPGSNEIADGGSAVLTNAGNTDSFAVWQIYGAFDSFTLTNTTVLDTDGNPVVLSYDDNLPPGSGTFQVVAPDYIEFGFFRGSGYLNGNQGSMMGGVRWDISEFFPLVPGPNAIDFAAVGGDGSTKAVYLANSAWA